MLMSEKWQDPAAMVMKSSSDRRRSTPIIETLAWPAAGRAGRATLRCLVSSARGCPPLARNGSLPPTNIRATARQPDNQTIQRKESNHSPPPLLLGWSSGGSNLPAPGAEELRTGIIWRITCPVALSLSQHEFAES